MTQTPTYDQLRGERINVDVPVSDADVSSSEVDLHPDAHLGKHHLPADVSTAVAVCGRMPRSRVDFAEDWSGFGTSDSDRPGKHWLRDDAPGAAGVYGAAPDLGADLVERWSWFGTGEPGGVDPANTARPVIAQREAPVVGTYQQRMDREMLTRGDYQGRHRLHFPPSAHACDTQQPGAVDASYGKADPAWNADCLTTY